MAGELRQSCVLCALKHIGQSRALAYECRKGYSHFFVFSLGHLAEAEDELVMDYPDLANFIRDIRKKWEDDPLSVPDFKMIVDTIMKKTNFNLDVVMEMAGVDRLIIDQ